MDCGGATVVTTDSSTERVGKDDEHGRVEDRGVLHRPGNASVLYGNVRVRGKRLSEGTADLSRKGLFGSIC